MNRSFKFFRDKEENNVGEILDSIQAYLDSIPIFTSEPEILVRHMNEYEFESLLDFYTHTIHYLETHPESENANVFNWLLQLMVDADMILENLNLRMPQHYMDLLRQLERKIGDYSEEIYETFNYSITEVYIKMKYFNYTPELSDFWAYRRSKSDFTI